MTVTEFALWWFLVYTAGVAGELTVEWIRARRTK